MFSRSLFFVALFALPLCAQNAKKIVFVSGPKDHGAAGRHEYPKDLTLLKYCIDSAKDKSLTTELHVGKMPDLSQLQDAAAIVIESSGDRVNGEYHPLFPPDPTTPDHKT